MKQGGKRLAPEPKNQRVDYYLEEWKKAVNSASVPTMKQAYETARKNDLAGQVEGPLVYKGWKTNFKENPQYKSKGVNADNLKLGNKCGATSYYALLFVGGPDKWLHWNDLERIHNVLKNKHPAFR